MLLNKPLTLLLLVVFAPSLSSAVSNTIKGAEVAKCITCVTANNNANSDSSSNFSFSWTDGTCSDDSTCGDSSDPDPTRCCVDPKCCSENGCRSPDDTSCARCCDEVSSGDGDVDCVVRTWSPDGSDVVLAPWYNDETTETETVEGGGGCDTSCPPCAVCSARDETELTALASGRSFAESECTAENCERRRGVRYVMNPCQVNSPSDDCDCFCWLANPLLDDCPHLTERVFDPAAAQEPAQQDPAQQQEPQAQDPVREDPVQDPQDQDDTGDAAGGGTDKVDDSSLGDVPAGEKQIARTSSGAAATAVTGGVVASLSAAVCLVAGTILQLLVLS